MTIDANAWAAATQAGNALGIDPSILYGQFAGETGNFTNSGSQNFNYGGIQAPGRTTFSSPSDFAHYFETLIMNRYPGAVNSGSNINQYVSGLQSSFGTYFGGTNNLGQQETPAMYSQMIQSNLPAGSSASTNPYAPTVTGSLWQSIKDWLSTPGSYSQSVSAATNQAAQAVSKKAGDWGLIVFGGVLVLAMSILGLRS